MLAITKDKSELYWPHRKQRALRRWPSVQPWKAEGLRKGLPAHQPDEKKGTTDNRIVCIQECRQGLSVYLVINAITEPYKQQMLHVFYENVQRRHFLNAYHLIRMMWLPAFFTMRHSHSWQISWHLHSFQKQVLWWNKTHFPVSIIFSYLKNKIGFDVLFCRWRKNEIEIMT